MASPTPEITITPTPEATITPSPTPGETATPNPTPGETTTPVPTPESTDTPAPNYSEDYTGLITEIRDISREQLLIHQEMRDTQYWMLFILSAMVALTLILVFFRGWKGEN